MSKKNTLIASAVLAGLFSGIALADEATTAAPAATADAKVEKKNECKGHKKAKHAKKKGDKNACGGANGCGGKEAEKPADAAKPAEAAK